MVGKDLNQIMREMSEPVYYTPTAVYGELLDKGGKAAVINPPYERRMMTQRDMMFRTARNLCRGLDKYGIKASYDQRVASVPETLRGCWYVPKLMQMGVKECIYINLPEGDGFFIVTDDCKVATGGNVMIVDAIQSIMIDIAEVDDYGDYFLRFKWHGHPEYEGSEWGVMMTDVTQLDRAFALVTKQLN